MSAHISNIVLVLEWQHFQTQSHSADRAEAEYFALPFTCRTANIIEWAQDELQGKSCRVRYANPNSSDTIQSCLKTRTQLLSGNSKAKELWSLLLVLAEKKLEHTISLRWFVKKHSRQQQRNGRSNCI
jgi:hypothetical protein